MIHIDCIRFELGTDVENVEIHTFADLHLGDVHADEKDIIRRLTEIKEKDNAYIILNGDLMNNATKTSVSDMYAEIFTPMEQIAKITDLFGDLKDRIIAVTSGNHENRTYVKEGIDITRIACSQLGIEDRYSKNGAFVFLQFGKSERGNRKGSRERRVCYTIYCTHGSGGGRKEGAKAIRLADMASIVDADIYIHSHTHLPMIMKQAFYRSNVNTHTVRLVDKLFVNTSGSLKYGGYGQAYEFKPSSIAAPTIYLTSKKHSMTAKL